jgi:REP element-mobilizing transposase RayT
LAKIHVHLIFRTKARGPLIPNEVREELCAYFVGILRHHESPALLANAVEDHVHILFSLSRNYAVKTVVEEVKKSSSKWIKTKSPDLQGFAWQNGYGAFSVSQSAVASTRRYIAGQEAHHRRTTFQDEFRRFLEKYEVPYDERYVWD